MSEGRSLHWDIWIAIGLQFAVAMTWFFVPVGFDYPSSSGLDVEHLALVYGIAAIYGVFVSIARRAWMLLTIQAAILMTLAWPVLGR